MSELTDRAKEIIDSDQKFIMVAFNETKAEVICKMSDDVLTNLGYLDTVIANCEGIRDAFEEELEDDMSDISEALTLAMLKLTAISQINPEIEPDLREIGQLIAKVSKEID